MFAHIFFAAIESRHKHAPIYELAAILTDISIIMTNIDESKKAFEVYKQRFESYISEDLTETDTRSKLIDNILIDVLGWQEEDIRREGHVDSGYFDYKVSVPGIYFIVEAKRQFQELKLPSNHKQASLKSLLSGNKEQIEQIRGYCIDESIAYGIITNGYQFIILKAFNIDNKPWKENTCLIFNDVNDIEGRFIEFYDNLSKFSIINNGGFKFDLPIISVQSKTVLSTLIDKDKELIRNSLSASITPIIDKIFGEIFSEEREDDLEFIKYCFVENKETKKNKSEIERLFGDYAPKIGQIIPAINSDNIASQISSEINDDEITIKNNYPPKPIIIIGSKGAGKTTFINHLFKYKLSEEEIENHFLIYIDFRKFFEEKEKFEPSQIATEIIEKIFTKYESLELHSLKVLNRIYLTEIKRNDESIWQFEKANDNTSYNKSLSLFFQEALKDSLKHLELLSKHLIRERRKRLVIIIDNADQFNDDIQKDLFVFAHSLTKSTLCGTVISLREGYYYKWQNSPPFDAYESNVYHITAPNYVEILQKRIDFALLKAPEVDEKVKGANQKGYNVEFSPEYITHFLAGLKNSILSTDNKRIIDFLNHTTYPNIREGLRIFKSFLISGHTKVSDYILREKFRTEQKQEPRSVIPMHEFIKSISLQNRLYYNSEISAIYNLFIPPLNSIDHFLRIYILMDLNEFIEKKSYTERLIPNSIIIEKLSSLGYRTNSINDAISGLINASLIDTDQQQSDILWYKLPSVFNLGLTGKGHYYLKEMITVFHYWDLIVQDTPIYDLQQFDIIRAEFPIANENSTRNIKYRIEDVRHFIKYLKSMEEKQSTQVKTVYGNIIDAISQQIEAEINRILRILPLTLVLLQVGLDVKTSAVCIAVLWFGLDGFLLGF